MVKVSPLSDEDQKGLHTIGFMADEIAALPPVARNDIKRVSLRGT